MAVLVRHGTRSAEPGGDFDRLDRLFDEWARMLPFRRPGSLLRGGWMPEDAIRVDEYQENGALVVRAEMPGIDPEKDVEVTISDGMLHIEAERREEERTEEKGYVRQELRYGSFSRSLPLPEGVTDADITASYADGILDIRIPAPEPQPARKIPIAKS